MSFWEDASGAVKAIIIVGAIGFAYLLLAKIAGLPPYSEVAEVQQVRGIHAPAE